MREVPACEITEKNLHGEGIEREISLLRVEVRNGSRLGQELWIPGSLNDR
jgi:hypothetical protein